MLSLAIFFKLKSNLLLIYLLIHLLNQNLTSMKSLFLSLSIAASLSLMSFTAPTTTNVETASEITAPKGSFKILNDTGSKLSIYTGSGYVTLNNGSSTSVTCKTGKKVYTASSGTKDDFLFEIESSMCGNTVRLSDYM